MSGRPLILVVDDDDDIRESVIDALGDEGFEAVGAAHGAAALDLLRGRSVKPAMIFLDLMMPVMSGADFRHEQRRDAALADIPVVLLTADPKADARSLDLGTVAALRKPPRLAALIAMAERFAPREAG